MRTPIVATVLALAPAIMALALDGPAFEREIHEVGQGFVAVRLDRHVYEAGRTDLGDLRVLDGRGDPVPYVLDRGDGSEPAEERMAPRWSRAFVDDPRETWLTVELGARHQPLRALVLEVEDPRFRRRVHVEARDEPVLGRTDVIAPAERWRPLVDGVVYRREERGEPRESLRIDVEARARMVRLRIEDRDDRPLRVTGVTAVVPVERLIFEGTEGGRYELTYGDQELEAPSYDLGQTLVKDVQVRSATLGPPVRRDVEADVLPWTERHPALLWVGLVLVVVALGALTWRALRAA